LKSTSGFALNGPWEVELNWGPVDKTESRKLQKLEDLAFIEGLENFAGSAVYSINFNSQETGYTILNLGHVHEIAEVSLNGKNLGVKWWGNRSYDISGLIREDGNVLEIKVTNILFNYVKSMKGNQVAEYWIGRSRSRKDKYPTGLIGPVRLL